MKKSKLYKSKAQDIYTLCAIDAKFDIQKINILYSCSTISDLTIQDLNNNWSITSENVNIKFDFTYYLFIKKIFADLEFQDILLKSIYKNKKLTILDSLKRILFSGTKDPFKLRSTKIKHGQTIIENNPNQLNLTFSAESNIKKTKFKIRNGYFNSNKNYINNISGNIILDKNYQTLIECSAYIKDPLNLLNKCSISGKFKNKRGIFNIKSENNNFESKIIVDPQNINFHAKIKKKDKILEANISGLGKKYSGIIHFKNQDNRIYHTANIFINNTKLAILGSLFGFDYKIKSSLSSNFNINSIIFYDGKDIVAALKYLADKNTYIAKLENEFIKKISKIFNLDYSGPGKINSVIKKLENNLEISSKFKNLAIRIPNSLNFIKSGSSQIILNLDTLITEIENLELNLYSGKIKSKAGIINFATDIPELNISLILENSLFGSQKSLFGLASGFVNIKNSLISGKLIFDHARFNGTIFDIIESKNKNNLNFDIPINISIRTRDPLKVNTEIFKTKISANLDIQGSTKDISLKGICEMRGGKIFFPYKPILINSGKIKFNNKESPEVNITAKAELKGYMLNFSVSGEINNPTITFSTSPFLNQEQIISLLFAGNPSGSLLSVVPAVIFDNLKNFLFNKSKFEQLKFFKNLKITPQIDNSDPKNIKGGVEIEISDKLRASVQNSLDLSQDSQIAVEYDLTDNIKVKTKKDERGDIYGELEMRWKL